MGLFDFLKKCNNGPITTYGEDNLKGYDFESYKEGVNLKNTTPFEYTNFYLKVDDVFTIMGKGSVVVGRIEAGVVNVGDKVWLKRVKTGKVVETEVVGIEMFRKIIESARVGENVGVFLKNINRNEVESGDIIYKE